MVVESAALSKVKHADGSKSVNGFLVREELGSGAFAKVKLCEQETTSEKFAMKVFRKGRLRRQREFVGGGDGKGMKVRTALDKVYNEVQIMKRISHPSCIQLYGVFDEDSQDGKMYIVIEFAAKGCTMEWDSDRCSYFVPGTGELIAEPLAARYLCGVLAGLGYLHGLNIAHRDVKPQNILVTADDRAKLGDFGVATELGEDGFVVGTEGTYHFYSPEMCRQSYTGHDARAADVWAAGVTLWAFLYGSVPFWHLDLVKLLETIAEGSYEIPAQPSVSPQAVACLRRLLTVDSVARPACAQLLEDSWCATAAADVAARAGQPT